MKRTWHWIFAAALAGGLACGGAAAQSPDSLSAAQKNRATPVVRAYLKARPAVVNITAQKLTDLGTGAFGQDPFDNIFGAPLLAPRSVASLGSGVLVHPSGYIVTNAHVVRRAQKITVVLHDKTQYDAKVISADPSHDLAVLKIDSADGKAFPSLPLGRSDDLMVGESVIAIGNPLGYANSVTTGVVSAVNRDLDFSGGVKYTGLIQTDAPINPGNSGGPLLNIDGELIGINSAIRADAQNIGFAIPVDLLSRDLAIMLDFERINRVVFGASIEPRHGAEGDELVVTEVRENTPAATRLQKGDRLTALNGAALRQMPDFTFGMLQSGGKAVRLACLRGGKTVEVEIPLEVKGPPDGRVLARKLLGLTLRPLDAQTAADLEVPVDRGLLVVDVAKRSPADQIGIRKKDVLFQVSQFYVKDMDELGTILEDVTPGSQVRIGIIRGNVAAWAPVQIPKSR